MSSFFSATPAAPTLQSYQQPSFNSALGQYLGQQTQLPALQNFATAQNTGANQAFQQMLYGTSPTLQNNLLQFGQNTQSLLNGQLPADVQTQIQNNAAYQALVGGFGGSNMAHALTARDIGQTSLQLQQQGASQLGQQAQLAAALNPSNVMPSQMFYSPQTILSSDQQSAMINNQIANQNQMIQYQNQLQSMKGSPFQQMLTNNLASMLGMVTNPMTALSSVMAAEGGNYNAGSAIPQESMGTYAVDPNTGLNIGSPTSGTGISGIVGSMGNAGAGAATGSSTAGLGSLLGMFCCFIFFEAFHQKMPWWVRECRDEFAPENAPRRRGYNRMAAWLVPAMRISPTIRWLVWVLMVSPLTKWGGWYKKVEGYEQCWIWKPVVIFWFNLWERMGGN